MERIYHTWDKWECYPAGFYEDHAPNGMSNEEAMQEYAKFLRDIPRFRAALWRVISGWKNSCEHYLSNENMNRIAWLGQAAMCIDSGIPSSFRSGYNLLTEDEQREADEVALEYLNSWLDSKNEYQLTLETAESKTKANLY